MKTANRISEPSGLVIRRQARPTLTAVELDLGETLEFTLADGRMRRIVLKETAAELVSTDMTEMGKERNGAMTLYRFYCTLEIDSECHELMRENSSQKSFYEPWEIAGMHIWLDAVQEIFTFLLETHGACRPAKQARFAIQDAMLRICPDTLHPWCPLPEGGIKVEQCYRGEDVWMGAYNGCSAHGGLDLNHPSGTPLWVPFDIDDHFLYNSVAMGHNNNRWRGMHRWPDGSVWIIQTCHMNHLTVDEHTPLKKGAQYADAAGVWVGVAEHTHFIFKVFNHGELVMLDPWILFWQMYKDKK